MTFEFSNWIKRNQLITYFVLAFTISWVLILPLVLSSLGILPLFIPDTCHVFGALGPIIAALIVTSIAGGRPGLLEFLKRMVKWRVGITWVLISVFSPFVLLILSSITLVLLGMPWPDYSLVISAGFLNYVWVVNSLLMGLAYGIGEEPGWRGFALPRLQSKWSAFKATLILYVPWALWHLPFFFYLYNFAEFPLWALSLFFGTVWLTFLYNSTGGSILMVMIWHSLWNVVDAIIKITSFMLYPALYALFWILVIIVVIIWKPRKLSTRDKETFENNE